MPRSSLPLLALLTAAAAPADAAAIERTFGVRAGGTLTVNAEYATIRLRGDAGDVRVEISRGGDDADEIERDYDIAFEQSGDDVGITVDHYGRSFWRKLTGSRRGVLIAVSTPREFDLDLRTSGGVIDVADVSGAISGRTSGGSIVLEQVDGPVRLRTSGGDIRLDGTSGDADVETSGGSIRLGPITGTVRAVTSGGNISIAGGGASVDARTSGGSITIDRAAGPLRANTSGGSIRATLTEAPAGDGSLITSGGSITLRMPPDSAFDIDARTSGGRVRIDDEFSLTGAERVEERRLVSGVNGGGPPLKLRTSGGSIRLRATSD